MKYLNRLISKINSNTEFQNQERCQYYNNHPDHVAFVQNIWLRNVEDFLEIDYKALD
ncbi:Dabb family protein [Flavobacterium sp. LB2R40]|uniref:Dabb family protein n=1 Tax=Flavobacterium sp. LB2R40 TaxID=3401722 RepID=UPI003AABF220